MLLPTEPLLGWPGRSHSAEGWTSRGPYVSSVGVKQTLPIRDPASVGAVAPPGQPEVSQLRHPPPALGRDRRRRAGQPDGAGDDSHADGQRRPHQRVLSEQCRENRSAHHHPPHAHVCRGRQCDGHGAFSSTLAARGDVAPNQELCTVQGNSTSYNCPLMNPRRGGEPSPPCPTRPTHHSSGRGAGVLSGG